MKFIQYTLSKKGSDWSNKVCYYLFIFLPHKFKFVSIKTVMRFVYTHILQYAHEKGRKSFQRKLVIKN